jgi:hypothetical protein
VAKRLWQFRVATSYALSLHLQVPSTPHAKLAALHLRLVLLELSSFLLLLSKERGVLALTDAPLLDAAEAHDDEQDEEETEGTGDDADLGALRESSPAVLDAGGRLDLLEDWGWVGCATAMNALVCSSSSK